MAVRVAPHRVTCHLTLRTLMCLISCKLTSAQYTWIFPDRAWARGVSCTTICTKLGTSCYYAAAAGWTGWPATPTAMRNVLGASGVPMNGVLYAGPNCPTCPMSSGFPNAPTYYDTKNGMTTCDTSNAAHVRYCPCTNKSPPSPSPPPPPRPLPPPPPPPSPLPPPRPSPPLNRPPPSPPSPSSPSPLPPPPPPHVQRAASI